jgi:hypothetical protein
MEEIRKKIIVNEIIYWKQNKLLPEQYCNYLLTLYTEGDKHEQEVEIKKFNKGINKLYLLFGMQILLFFPILALIGVLKITSASILFSITIGSLIAQIAIVYVLMNKKSILMHFSTVLVNLYFLLSTILLIDVFFKSTVNIYLGLLICCSIWFLEGKFLNFIYLKVAAYLGFLLMIFNLVNNLL